MPIDGSTDVAESAVRNYLLFIEDPDKLVDKELIAQLRKKAQETPDPVERLKVYAELHRAECSDEDKYKADFIRHAKAWAAANNVDAVAFRQLKVDDSVLRSAGLFGKARRPAKQSHVASAPARSSVSAESIKSYVRSLNGTFTLADIQASVGGSPMTVRKGVQALVSEGAIKRLGPVRDWRGRGRAPIAFEVS
jgi:hypothetical protein